MNHHSVLKWETFSKLVTSNQLTSIGNLCVLERGRQGSYGWQKRVGITGEKRKAKRNQTQAP